MLRGIGPRGAARWNQSTFTPSDELPADAVHLRDVTAFGLRVIGIHVRLPVLRFERATVPRRLQLASLFYVRATANTCGRGVNLRERTIGGTDTALAPLPRGYDIGATSATDEGGGVTTVYFDRVNCATGLWDIYKITVS